ncbi:MAG: FixH family protein [Polyangiaceae bacterium]
MTTPTTLDPRRIRSTWASRAITWLLAAACCAPFAGCSSADGGEAEVESAVGARGVMRFTATPEDTLVEGANRFHVEIVSVEGDAPIAGAALNAHVTMRSMGHDAPGAPEVSELDHGDYRVDEVIFTMPGLWELRLEAETDADYDEVAFLFEVP